MRRFAGRTLDPAAASPISPNRTAPVTVCTSREMRNPEYAVSSVSTPIAAVPGNHPSLHHHSLRSERIEVILGQSLQQNLCHGTANDLAR